MQSRYYDAGTGRFINADAYVLTNQGIIGHNLFAYCLNNPVNKIDETGTFAIEIILGIGVLIFAVVTSIIIVQHNYTASKRPGNTYDSQYEGLDDIVETTETIIAVEVAVITYKIESVSNDGETDETDEEDEYSDDYYQEGLVEVPDDWLEVEAAEELKVKSGSFKDFLNRNGKNPKNWRKVVEKWASSDETFYQRNYWTNGKDYYYHGEGIEIFIPH